MEEFPSCHLGSVWVFFFVFLLVIWPYAWLNWMEQTQNFCSNSCHIDTNPERVIWRKRRSLWGFPVLSLSWAAVVEMAFYVSVFAPHSSMHFVPLDLFCLETLCHISIPVALQGSCDLRPLPPSSEPPPFFLLLPFPSSFSILWAAALLYKKHREQIKIDGQSCEMWALGDALYGDTFFVRVWSGLSRQRILCRPTSPLPSLDHGSNSIGDRQAQGFLDVFFLFPYKRVVSLSALIMPADAHCG